MLCGRAALSGAPARARRKLEAFIEPELGSFPAQGKLSVERAMAHVRDKSCSKSMLLASISRRRRSTCRNPKQISSLIRGRRAQD